MPSFESLVGTQYCRISCFPDLAATIVFLATPLSALLQLLEPKHVGRMNRECDQGQLGSNVTDIWSALGNQYTVVLWQEKLFLSEVQPHLKDILTPRALSVRSVPQSAFILHKCYHHMPLHAATLLNAYLGTALLCYCAIMWNTKPPQPVYFVLPLQVLVYGQGVLCHRRFASSRIFSLLCLALDTTPASPHLN